MGGWCDEAPSSYHNFNFKLAHLTVSPAFSPHLGLLLFEVIMGNFKLK